MQALLGTAILAGAIAAARKSKEEYAARIVAHIAQQLIYIIRLKGASTEIVVNLQCIDERKPEKGMIGWAMHSGPAGTLLRSPELMNKIAEAAMDCYEESSHVLVSVQNVAAYKREPPNVWRTV